jgi:hypothetical protein
MKDVNPRLLNYLKRKNKKCLIPDCDVVSIIVRGYCTRHYYYLIRYGKPVIKKEYSLSRQEARDKLLLLLGSVCQECGFHDKRALHIGHRKSNGNLERKVLSDYAMYKFYLRNPELMKSELILQCANCNWITKSIKKEYSNQYTKLSYK